MSENLRPLPLPVEALPESLHRFANPNAPGPAKMMAARGMVPAKGADLVTLLTQLAFDDDQAVCDAASKSLADLPDNVIVPACAGAMPPEILNHLAEVFAGHAQVQSALVLNGATAAKTVEKVAKTASEELCETIALNEQRVLAYPAIIEALYKNKNTRMSTADRLIELAARNGLELTGIPCFKEHAQALRGQLIPEASDEPLPGDNIFSEALELDEDSEEVFEQGSDQPESEQLSDKFKPLSFRIANMSPPEKMRLAMIGDAAARAIIIRDNNKQVAMSAVKSPKMRDKEAAAFANSREIGEDILRYIANRREWTRNYDVKRSLIFNPKTPVGIALKFLSHLRDNDLKRLAKSKNVAGSLKSAAIQRMDKKSKR